MNDTTMPSTFIENRTYDEIQVGDVSTLVRTLRPEVPPALEGCRNGPLSERHPRPR